MPRAQRINAHTGEILEDLGWFETAHQARSACGKHAEHFLVWGYSPDGLWVTQEDDEVYHVEADPPEGSATA
ncbi:hypothetical protein GCM10022631_01530 [Deinococcus rubellus]|uniref:Uncharacterized protein n=1 Tax=Deinococcus rubellus TaxID=1889240 RepID=A0ABY5YLT7_9DEIO|nr:hypothetical protein [Deinococcus rubellus]UWX64733.1 hypothetical protein N0D28_03480 [Deinococcus rubellus]